MELPLATRIAIASGNWLVRMLPFIMLGGILGAPFIGGAIAVLVALCMRWRRLLSILVGAAIMASLVGILASAFVVVAIKMAY
jgi:hypothetical protein